MTETTGDRPILTDADTALQADNPPPPEPPQDTKASPEDERPAGPVDQEKTLLGANQQNGDDEIDWDNPPQEVIDALTKRKAARVEREKINAEIEKTRDDTQPAIDLAKEGSSNQKKTIDDIYNPTQQDTLLAKIKAAEKQVADAEKAVTTQDDKVKEASGAFANAKKAVTDTEQAYSDKKKELAQFAAKIKDNLKLIERLRSEVDNALATRDYVRAFYKHDQLQTAIADDDQLRDATLRQARLIAELNTYEDRFENGELKNGSITTAKQAQQQAQVQLEADTRKQKQLKEEHKRLQEGLENKIALLTPDSEPAAATS